MMLREKHKKPLVVLDGTRACSWTRRVCERSAHASLGPACFCSPLGLLCVKTALRVVYVSLESDWQGRRSATPSNHNHDVGIQST